MLKSVEANLQNIHYFWFCYCFISHKTIFTGTFFIFNLLLHLETIEELTCKLGETEVKIKELENTIRLQEQNIKAKDGSINKQKTSIEKLKNEIKEKTTDLNEKSELIENLESEMKTGQVSVCDDVFD